MSRVEISLLGSFRVTLDGNPITQFEADTARALLAYLIMNVESPHRRETLAGLLWTDLPESAALRDLRQALNRLRSAVGDREARPPFLQISRQAIQFNPASNYWLDVIAFNNLINSCETHCRNQHTRCLDCMQRLQKAVELYRGDFLAGFSSKSTLFEEWLTVQRQRLHHSVMEAYSQLAAYCEQHGDYSQARQYALRQLELEPWQEEAHQRLMRVLALSGERSAALIQYEACRRILKKELGLAPSAETVALYEHIRAGEMKGNGTAETLPDRTGVARQARRKSERKRVSHQRPRRQATFGLLASLILMVILALLSVFDPHQAEQQRRITLSSQLAAQAINYLDDQGFDLAALLSLEAYRLGNTLETRSSLLAVVERIPYRAILRYHTGPVSRLAFSSDGRMLVSSSDDGMLMMWDVKKGQPIRSLSTGRKSEVGSVAFSPDGRTLALGNADSTIVLWDVTTGQPFGPPLIGHMGRVTSLAFSPNGQTLASGSKGSTWGSVDNTVMLWDVTTGRPTDQLWTGHTGNVTSVAFSPDGQTLAAGCDDGAIILWNISTDEHTRRSLHHISENEMASIVSVNVQVAFSPNGSTLASGGSDGAIVLWDMATMQPQGGPLFHHKGGVTSLAFSPDGQTLASGGEDKAVILWVIGPSIGRSVKSHPNRIWSVAISPDGRTLASGTDNGTIILRTLATGESIGQPLTGHTAGINDLTFSPDGKTLVSGSDDGTIILWGLVTDQPVSTRITGHPGGVNSIDFSPDGRILASGGRDHKVILWDVATRRPLGPPLTDHTDGIWSVAFSPDGQMLASGSWDKTLILWDVTTHLPLGPPLIGHADAVLSVAFSSDGHRLASAGRDGTIILWDVATAQPAGSPFTDHTDSVWSIAFGPDGQLLASASCSASNIYKHCTQSEVRLWDSASGHPIGRPLIGHDGVVWDLAFSPDGQTLVSGGDDGTIILWNVSLEWWQARACTIASRNLTRDEWRQYLGSEPYRKTCSNLP